MRGVFVLPLYPLQGVVLLPGGEWTVAAAEAEMRAVLSRAHDLGGAVVAALADGGSVHEVGVTAMVIEEDGTTVLRGLGRCRLLALVNDDVMMARAERYPERAAAVRRDAPVARLLQARYERLCRRIGRESAAASRGDLSTLTWRVTAGLAMPPEQQQGFLNVPDPLTRARLLLLAVRELERRERFLRQWAHLRTTNPWN